MELAYQEMGEGKPVIIMHGLFGSAKNWGAISKQMSRKYRILAVDLRNHGNSPWTNTMSYGEMADDLEEFLDQRGLDKCNIVGHSMGGKVAMTFALTRPERVEKLAVCDIAPVKYPRFEFRSYIEKLLTLDLNGVKRRNALDPLISDVIEEPAVRAFLLNNLQNDGEGGLKWQVNLEVLNKEMDNIGGVAPIRIDAKYEGPTIFINGAESEYVQTSHHQLIRHLFPNVHIHEIENAGHWVHAQKPHEFMEKLSEFLA